MRGRKLWMIIAIILVVVGPLAWWLISPLFISKTVREEFPFSATAVVPENMKRGEVEQVMAGLAKVDEPMEEPMLSAMVSAEKIKSGSFRDADAIHKGSGRATIYRLPDGSYFLRLENFKVTNGPALHVLLSQHPNPESRDDIKGYLDLGNLKGNIGNQNYVLPSNVSVASQQSVVIYCKPFRVLFSIASLHDGG